MALRKDWDDLADNGNKGDWYFFREDTYITIRYGDDRFDVVTIPIDRTGNAIYWQWDGNKEMPTISPSIKITAGKERQNAELWHGWLRAGELINA